jgi:uncharacterized protein (TIRG00374 family)
LSVSQAVEIVFIGSLGNLLIARAGDLMRAALTSRRRGADISQVLGTLIVERFADVLMLLVLAAGLSLFVNFPTAIRAGVALFTVVALTAVATLWLAPLWLPAPVRRVVGVFSPALAEWAVRLIENVSRGIRSAVRGGQLSATVGLSIAMWFVSALSIVFMMRAFALPVPWIAGLFVMMVVNLGGVIPASPGAIGVYQFLVVLALSLWTRETSSSLGFAVVNHAMSLLTVAVAGIIALMRQGIRLSGLSADWTLSAAGDSEISS